MDLDMAGIDHQPFETGLVNCCIQRFFSDALVPPTAKTAMGVLPVSVIRGQVAPRRPGVRRIQNTTFRNRRLSKAGLPTVPAPPGKWGFKQSRTRSDRSAGDVMLS